MTVMNPRSPIAIGGIVVALLVGLGAFMLARTGSGEPPAAAPVAAPTATPSPTEGTPTAAPAPEEVEMSQGSTALQIRVNDCDGCQVTAVPTNADGGADQWSATVSSGIAQLDLPTPNTLGLAFFIQGEKDGNDTPKRTLVLLQPDGVAPGEAVSGTAAADAKSGGYCWAGTTLNVATVQFSARQDGSRIQQAWADPALPTLAPQVETTTKTGKPFTPTCAKAG